ncbi:DUF4340 domain-containing protein [Paraglaciecola aquimarina]|uniref:DUF4340 domain-containing protein n=1 Tax=Paraglaciecola algarum TaxID=3050085 RepID=A0ABS9D0V8_9ALTE|nr:DUF4340 domain-containing protein [Paraglaciecola sp. G1-23]MCF2946559.1 DUF4340 domain-containing protein [Paraglaciecola sp. G1-23]
MNKQLMVLISLVVVSVAAGTWLLQKPSTDEFETQLLFQDLNAVAENIDTVKIENSAGSLLSAFKSEGEWLAKAGYSDESYPVDQSKLSDLVTTLLQTKIIEAKTKVKRKHHRLGLQDISVEDSVARLVTIQAGSQSWQVLVGNSFDLGEGHYVRLVDQAQTWRLDKTIDLPIEPFAWLTHPILPFTEQNILAVSRVDGSSWSMFRDDSNQSFSLTELPKDRELQYQGILDGFVSSLIGLDYEELVAPESTFVDSLEVVTRLEMTTKRFGVINVIVSQGKDIHYAHFESAENNEYWQNWYYQISSYAAQQLNKSIDDFLSPTESNTVSKPLVVEEEASVE